MAVIAANTFMRVLERVSTLQQLMKNKGISAYIIPSSDPHQSEYVADHFKSRQFISGFDGSAGTVVITIDKGNGLWTDGRYFLQAEEQLKGSSIELYKMGEKGVPSIIEWLKNNITDGSTIGFDGRLFSAQYVNDLKQDLKNKNFNFYVEEDLIEQIWNDRPSMPKEKVLIHNIKFAGKTATEKIRQVRELMIKEKADAYIIASLDDIAWLYNIRGNDVKYSPVAYSYAFITSDKAYLFIDKEKVIQEVKEILENEGISLMSYESLWDVIESLNGDTKVALDLSRINNSLYEKVKNKCEVVEIKELTANLKAVKNQVEIENLRKCNIKDNVAMVKFLYWLKNNIGKVKISELDVENKLLELRGQMDLNIGASFATIAGYAEHGAIIHYKATEESNKELQPEGFILVDSGGQYYDGTTDITRTIVLGPITEEMKKHFTLVLKGNIRLSNLKFKQGIKGCQIDVLARTALWEYGLDYRHGTGHGLGFSLNVHEGPQSISEKLIDVELKPGMVVTNEPGYYAAGQYGIRIENDLLVTEAEKTQWGQFFKFETLTYCPIDIEAIDVQLLTDEERQFLNDYHKKTYELLSPYLTEEEKEWLKINTREI